MAAKKAAMLATIPVFRVVLAVPPTAPLLSAGTEFMIDAKFGDAHQENESPIDRR